MRLFVFGPDLSIPQWVWMNIFWPHYQALSQCVPTTFLPMPVESYRAGWVRRKIDNFQLQRANTPALLKVVREDFDASGPNILLVYALNSRHADFASMLDGVWDKFDFRILNVVDTLQPNHLASGGFSRFDLILSSCADIAEDFRRETQVTSMYFPPHCDVLAYHSLREIRPLDLILVGRRDAERHAPLHRYFNAPERDRIFLDFVTRTQSTPLPEVEFELLMATYSRSKAAFCYEPSASDRFIRRSPLTGRWIHAWASGCTVLGKAPLSQSAAEQMDWPEATIDLPEEPGAAIEAVEAVISDLPSLARRRRRNVFEAMSRHDTRLRLGMLLKTLDLPAPETLVDQLDRLERAVREISVSG